MLTMPKVPKLDARSGSPAAVASLAVWLAYPGRTPGLSPERRAAAMPAVLSQTVTRRPPQG